MSLILILSPAKGKEGQKPEARICEFALITYKLLYLPPLQESNFFSSSTVINVNTISFNPPGSTLTPTDISWYYNSSYDFALPSQSVVKSLGVFIVEKVGHRC